MEPRPRILYIDDEADLLELAASFFEEENMPIDTCTHIQGAMEMVRKNTYDLIITDLRMPRGSGYELLSMIRNESSFKGKVVLVTGNIESIGQEENHQCDLVLFKPLRFQELIDRVKDLLPS